MAQMDFWNLRASESTARVAELVHEEMELEHVICPVDAGHRHAGKRLTNLSVALRGKGVEDFVWTWYSECLVQDHVLELFKARRFTGFDVKPAKARFKHRSEQARTLWELIVTGWAGMAPPESGIKLIEHCPACRHQVYSACTHAERLIVPSHWDGSDFFIVWPLPNFIFVTDRVAKVVRENRLKGAVLKQPNELDLSGGFTPGRLSYQMPPERARELGAALGID